MSQVSIVLLIVESDSFRLVFLAVPAARPFLQLQHQVRSVRAEILKIVDPLKEWNVLLCRMDGQLLTDEHDPLTISECFFTGSAADRADAAGSGDVSGACGACGCLLA